MNKLVSRNPVLRFKLGRKIVKAQFGLHVREDGVVVNAAGVPVYTTNGGYTPTTMTLNASYQRDYPADVQILPGLYLETETNDVYASRPENEEGNAGYALISKGNKKTTSPFPTLPTKSSNDLDPNRVARRHDYGKGEVTYHLDKNTGIWYAKWNDPTRPNLGWYKVAEGSTGYNRAGDHNVLRDGLWVKIEKTPAKKPASVKTVTPSYTFGKLGGWNRNIGVGNITDLESLRMLLEMGLSGSALDIQNEINKVFGSNAVKADNKWGNQSRAGLLALYDKWKKELSVNYAPELPTSQQLVEHVQSQMKPIETNVLPTIYQLMSQLTNGFTLTPTLSKTASTSTTQMPSLYEDMLRGKYKIGGQLPSRNIVERFKQRNFSSGPVTTLKTGGNIPKLQTAWLPINWNDNNKFVDLVVSNVANEVKKAKRVVENQHKANNVANRKTKVPGIDNTAKLQLVLYDKGFFKGVIDKRRTGKQVTLERAVDGYMGDMTNQAIQNAKKAGYIVDVNTGEIKLPKKKELAYGKTPKKLPQQLQQASTFSFDKLKSLGKEFYGRVFGDKDMLTGRNELEEKAYQQIYNTPYSWRLDMDKVGETDGGEAGYLYPQFDSKLGKLGLFNRQVDEDGRVCYQMKNDKGQLVTRCSEAANLINRALKLPTTGDAWNRYGVWGDSLTYGQPDHNKFYTRPVGKVINGLRPDLLDPNNLKTGDFVDLYTEGSGHNAEAATGRGNSHTGTIYRPQGDKGPVYIIHGGINKRVYVDPLAQFGPTHTWSIMSVRRPGSKEHPYYKEDI